MRNIDIERILRTESLAVWFQPIVSVRRQSIQILEALTRGIDPGSGELIPPLELFGVAEIAGRLGELELLCIRKALENFSRIQQIYPDTLISLNIGNRLLDELPDFTWFDQQLQRLGIPCNRVIIEVLESVLIQENAYADFLDYCRTSGMLIAIDDVGSQYSGLIRIVEIKPDLIKIDRSLISMVNKEKWQLEVVRALTGLAHRTGVLVVAEGIETDGEALVCMEMGIDLHQGFLYSRAHSFDNVTSNHGCHDAMQKMAVQYRHRSLAVQTTRRASIRGNMQEINEIYDELVKVSYDELGQTLQKLIQRFGRVQFLYVLNDKGVTITDTVGQPDNTIGKRRYIFRPARKGEDLSLKDYFLWLQTGLNKYVSDPYISSATGEECVTYSVRFTTADHVLCVLCIDISAEYLPGDVASPAPEAGNANRS